MQALFLDGDHVMVKAWFDHMHSYIHSYVI